MAKAKAIPKLKRRKKKWHKIYASKQFNEVELGVSQVYDSSELLKKRIKVSLLNLMNNIKKQNVFITFEVEKINEGNGYAKPVAYNISQTQIKRFVRQNRTRIDDSLIFRTRDNIRIRIKPLVITNSRCPKSASQAIRKSTKELIAEKFTKLDLNSLFDSLIKGELQKEIKDNAGKIFPIKFVEIRSAAIELGKKDRRIKEQEAKKATKELSKSEEQMTFEIEEKVEDKKPEEKESKEESKESTLDIKGKNKPKSPKKE